jgi:signal transduction histidine kinase
MQTFQNIFIWRKQTLIIMLMGSSLIAHSEDTGKGATFTLELPVQPESTTQAVKK